MKPDDRTGDAPKTVGRLAGTERFPAGAPLDLVLYVVGGIPSRNPAMRTFPLVNRQPGEAEVVHLERVVQLVGQVIAAGGTHLLVPREHADWLGDHPLVAEYFAEQHEMVDASAETGIVFALYS